MATPWRSEEEREEFLRGKACIDCESCFHKEVCSYYKASNGHIVLCEHWCNDVVEVRHGEWIKNQYISKVIGIPVKKEFVFICSLCGHNAIGKSKYCRECGAKMDKTKKGN